MRRKSWFLLLLLSIIMMSACTTQQQSFNGPSNTNNTHATSTTQVIIPGHMATPTSQSPSQTQQPARAAATTPSPATAPTPQNARANGPIVTAVPSAAAIPNTGKGVAPYGSPPTMTSLEKQLTQQLFGLINNDRASRGLYSYSWNETLSGGARLHSWNMFHCGFSHTCPDGLDQCKRISNEGFMSLSDCGENIGYAGPFPSAWQGVAKIQETMVNEPPTGWHRIHLFSTDLHSVGVGVFVDPNGYIWFTEDMIS